MREKKSGKKNFRFDGFHFLVRLALFLPVSVGLGFVGGWPKPVFAHSLRGFVAGEARLFTNPALQSEQENHEFSGVAAPEYYHEFDDGSLFTLVPFYRQDSVDSQRTHFDLREFTLVVPRDGWELRLGVRKVFWGVTETQHLVDIINQTDLVESPDLEEKLGQPMINLSIDREWGTLDFFYMPFFRERTFPGRRGRLRLPLVVDTGQTAFESPSKEWHTDIAFRYFNTIGKWDIGLSEFVGTGREPSFRLGLNNDGNLVLTPLYEQINQTGLDVLFVEDNWIWKLEVIHRNGQGNEDFFAWIGGFEYTFSGLAGRGMDLGVLGEWSFDDREDESSNPLQNDLTAGLRFAFNDVEGTEILIALVQDLKRETRSFFIEASSRLTDHWRLTFEFRALFDQPLDDPGFALRDDDFFQVELAYHF
ncbi:MAG: hypothetical protein ACE5E9_06235 [Nitrospinaceae bacterium]